MDNILRTPLYDRHVALGAKMVEFGGWLMPLQYPRGIVQEHLATRKSAGLFDVSHMGRFLFRGPGALSFLQHTLTSNAAALAPGRAQYTMIPNPRGGALDDAYLYRFVADEYLLVVNAANRQKDWDHFEGLRPAFANLEIADRTNDLAMLSLQGPVSEQILGGILDSPSLPAVGRNALGIAEIGRRRVLLARTGYTGEPLCFDIILPAEAAAETWGRLLSRGAVPVGLGARDTLRLEARLPLYGHELGADPEGNDIPIFSCPLARFAVSFAPAKGDFIGRSALLRQHEAATRLARGDPSLLADLPRRIVPLALLAKGVARAGNRIYRRDAHVGHVTSGTMTPYWLPPGAVEPIGAADILPARAAGVSPAVFGTGEAEMASHPQSPPPSPAHALRPIALALIDSSLGEGDGVAVDVRGNRIEARIAAYK